MSEALYHADIAIRRTTVATGVTILTLAILMIGILAVRPQPTGPPIQDISATPDDHIVEVEAGEFSTWTDAPGILIDVSLTNDE